MLEACARGVEWIWAPLPVDYGLGFDSQSRLFGPDPERPGWLVTRPQKRLYFRTQRLARSRPPGVRRVAALGGSSVNFAQAALAGTLNRVSEDLGAPIELINAGGLSYGSHRLVPLLEEILEYDLDLLLIYSGHNEFEEAEQRVFASSATRLERSLDGLALFRMIRDTVTRTQVVALGRDHESRMQADGPPQGREWALALDALQIDRLMQSYHHNLRQLVERARAVGVAVVIGTVPSNLLRPWVAASDGVRFEPLAGLYAEGRFSEGVALAQDLLTSGHGRRQASRTENEVIRTVARELAVPLADVERAVIESEPHRVPGETLFLDHCHLSRAGNVLMAGQFEPFVRRALGDARSPARAP